MWSWSKKKPAEPTAAQKNANRLARLSFAKGVGAPSSRASTRSSSEPAGSMARLAESPYASNDEEAGEEEVESLAASSSRGAASTGSAPSLNMYRSPAAFGQRGTMRAARNASRVPATAALVAAASSAAGANAAAANAATLAASGANASGANASGANASGANAAVVGGRKSRRNKRRTYRRRR